MISWDTLISIFVRHPLIISSVCGQLSIFLLNGLFLEPHLYIKLLLFLFSFQRKALADVLEWH